MSHAKSPKKDLSKAGFFRQTKISDDDSDTTTTEDWGMEEDTSPEQLGDDLKEALFRQEVRDWLSLNGKALFGLESSKFLTKQRKSSHAVKPIMARTGAMVTPLSIRDTGN